MMDYDAFGERLATILGQDPTYYRLLISDEPGRRMWDLVESLALEGDPEHPETTLALLEELSEGLPPEQADRWLAGLRDAAQQLYLPAAAQQNLTPAARLLSLICANPNLYELVAAVEPGEGLLEIVESMALEGDVDDLAAMLRLLREAA